MCSQGWAVWAVWAVPKSSEAVSEQTSYSLGAVESSSQKAVASWLAAEVAEEHVEELVGPMEVVVVVVGVAQDPRRSQAVAPAAAESTAVGAEAEEALGPRGLNWPEAAEEGLGAASKEAVSEAVQGSSLTVVAAAEQ